MDLSSLNCGLIADRNFVSSIHFFAVLLQAAGSRVWMVVGASKHCALLVELFAQPDRCVAARCRFLLQRRFQRAADLKLDRHLDLESVVIKCGILTVVVGRRSTCLSSSSADAPVFTFVLT